MSSTKVNETVETCYHRPHSPFTSQNLETTDTRWIWQQLTTHCSPEIRDFFHPRKLASSNVYEILSEAAVDYCSMLNGIP